MPNYAKTIIYRLVCNDTNITECYVGSTTNMTKRKQNHKKECNDEKRQSYNSKKYIFIRANGGFINWSMIMIEEYPCESNLQARQRERYWMEYFTANLNMVKAFIDKEETKLLKKEYNIKYKQQNAEKIKKYKTEYYQINADKKKKYNKDYREKQKLLKSNE